jgi:hypothetical protein
MSLTFYFAPMSTASITEAVLAELGIPFDLVKLNISVGDTSLVGQPKSWLALQNTTD